MALRQIRIALQHGQARTATFRGREFTVLPVVMLTEGVLHASNAASNELVLASEFSKNLNAWNGRPIMDNHPTINGTAVPANDPRVLEGRQLGYVFNVKYDASSKKLKGEAWLDPELVTAAGSDILERVAAGTIADVSVGVTVTPDETSGDYKGTHYSGVWRNITPDHLAILPEGLPGACSVEMGCGLNRAAGGPGSGIKGHTTDKDWTGGEHGVEIAKTFDKAEVKQHMSAAHTALTAAGFKKGEKVDASTKAEKLGRSEAYSARTKGSRTTYTHADGRSATLVEHSPKYGEKSVAVYVKRNAATSRQGGTVKLKDRLAAIAARFTAAADEASLSSEGGINDIKNDLWSQLYQVVPAFGGIIDVFPAEMMLIYSVNEGEGKSCLYRVGYTLNGTESMLADISTAVEVEEVTSYETKLDDDGNEVTQTEGAEMYAAKKVEKSAAGYGAVAKKAETASAAAKEASEGADSASDHDTAADAHATAALAHGAAALVAKQAGNTTAQTAHMNARMEHEKMAAEHGDKAVEDSDTKKKTAAANGCGCGGARTAAKGESQVTKKDIVSRILSHATSPFKAEDAAVLEQLSEARLTEIESRCASEVKTETPKAAAAAPATITKEQVFELFPEIGQIVSGRQASDAAKRTELTAKLKTAGGYTDEELQGMSVVLLEKTAKAIASATPAPKTASKKVDFSGLGAPRNANDEDAVPAPPSVKDRLLAARGLTVVPKKTEAAS